MWDIFFLCSSCFYVNIVYRDNRLKDNLQEKIPQLRFYKPTHSQFASLICYSSQLTVEDLIERLSPQLDNVTTTDDDTTDDDIPPANLSLSSGIKLEFRHVSDLVNRSLSSVPKQYKTWPPVLEDFSLDSCMKYSPTELYNLIACITGLMKDVVADPYVRVDLPHDQHLKVASICQDIIYIWSKGRIQPPKTLALGLTLRHLTGNKRVNDILSALVHAASYQISLGLETALAMSQHEQGLPPEFQLTDAAAVCWDNIDFSNETVSGGGTAHYVNGILLQPITQGPVTPNTASQSSAKISKSVRKLPRLDSVMASAPHNRKQGPSQVRPASLPEAKPPPGQLSEFTYVNMKNAVQDATIIPPWTDFQKETSSNVQPMTRIHYLPLILAPATEADTIATILHRTLQIADQLKLDRIVAVFDLAIYAKIQEQRWSDRHKVYLDRIIPRLGEFHTTMSYLGVIGKRFGDGGLAAIWTEADLVAPGSLNATLSGKQYNRAMRSHKVLFEALYRLQLQGFISTLSEDEQSQLLSLSELLSANYRDSDQYEQGSQTMSQYLARFQHHKSQQSDSNPTYRYWNSYMEMVQTLLTFTRASRTNNWDLHLECVDWMIPWYFAYDRSHYSR